MEGPSGQFIGAMAGTGYLQVIAAFQVIGGLFLLIGKYVPLGLTMLGPIIVNIVLFHIFLDRAGLAMGLAVCAVWLFCSGPTVAPSRVFCGPRRHGRADFRPPVCDHPIPTSRRMQSAQAGKRPRRLAEPKHLVEPARAALLSERWT